MVSDMDENERIGEPPKRRLNIVTIITAVILVVLLIAFFTVTMRNVSTINSEVSKIKNGPYPVSVASGHIETLLVELQTLAGRPSYLNSPELAEEIASSYEKIDSQMREQLTLLTESDSENSSEIDSLIKDYDELYSRQMHFAELCYDTNVSDEEVLQYARESLYPLIERMLTKDLELLDESTDYISQMYNTVTEAGFQTIVLSSVLLLAVLIALAMYLGRIYINRKRERILWEQLQEALSAAHSANTAKSSFLANMSHDIRTPMNAIVGLTTIAKNNIEDPERVKDCLTQISISSRHLLGLINDILDMGKIESGKITLREDEFSFPDLVSEFITIVQPQAKAKSLNFDVVISNIEQENLIGDTMRINQILLNLASNAIKYTNEGDSVRISITEKPSIEPGCNNYCFEVSDTGIGMSEEFLERIYDAFERERNDVTRFTEGTGLGMAITKNIVELMGGTIDVESELGVGTTIRVVIPLRAADAKECVVADPVLCDLHILLVDDDIEVLENTRVMFDEAKMRSRCVASGREAVESIRIAHDNDDDYKAMIIDWMMPGMDGLQTVQNIRSVIGNDMPIIMISAYDWSEIEDQARQAGVAAFISKPLFKSRLYKVLADVMKHQQALPENQAAPLGKGVTGKVLLVEDNELNMAIAKELIESFGANVDTACDGLKAVEKVEQAPKGEYGMIFMDWQMPKMDGIEATKRIIAFEKSNGLDHTPIVAMTANAFREDRDSALAAGMDGFMAKPINLKELEHYLKKYLS
ncbi:MAG: response regulator [Eggerthellaceae bacterium]|nr:response regulator [Eggerthellaceae bacterium]